MKQNVGGIDRAVRLIGGAALVGIGYTTNIWLLVIGVVLLFTALVGWCPPYSLLGVSTCKYPEGN